MQYTPEVLDSQCFFVFSTVFTPAATALSSSAPQAITVPSGTPPLKLTDSIFVCCPASGNAVAAAGARVTSATTVEVKFVNPTAGALTHAAGTFGFLVIR
jgi:hypothetical protein